MDEGWRIVTHGGAGSHAQLSPVTDEAAQAAEQVLAAGYDPLAAACRAVAFLEDDGRFNAGRGSNVRADGDTVEMDAACADSEGRFGAVACLRETRYPVKAARVVADTDHLVLAGEGAHRVARERGLETLSPEAFTRREDAPATDTVGCVVGDGETFAAALSSGGTKQAMVGRVGDVPLPGCGLRTGEAGAVAATGHGEVIARHRLADQVYHEIADGRPVREAVEDGTEGFGDRDVGLIAVAGTGAAGAANTSMAFTERR
jgi:isoaspartyl peptidase/L-asparaginase-like protein (Ntn-hydrolase superfamily)